MDWRWSRSRVNEWIERNNRYFICRKFVRHCWMNYIEWRMKWMNNFYHLKMIFNYDIRKAMKLNHQSMLNVLRYENIHLDHLIGKSLNHDNSSHVILFSLICFKHRMFEVFEMFLSLFCWYSSCKWRSTISFEMDGKEREIREEWKEKSVFRLILDFELVFHCFGNLHIALFIWLIMKLCTAVVVFIGFHYWMNNRISYLKNKKNLSKYSNISWWLFWLIC